MFIKTGGRDVYFKYTKFAIFNKNTFRVLSVRSRWTRVPCGVRVPVCHVLGRILRADLTHDGACSLFTFRSGSNLYIHQTAENAMYLLLPMRNYYITWVAKNTPRCPFKYRRNISLIAPHANYTCTTNGFVQAPKLHHVKERSGKHSSIVHNRSDSSSPICAFYTCTTSSSPHSKANLEGSSNSIPTAPHTAIDKTFLSKRGAGERKVQMQAARTPLCVAAACGFENVRAHTSPARTNGTDQVLPSVTIYLLSSSTWHVRACISVPMPNKRCQFRGVNLVVRAFLYLYYYTSCSSKRVYLVVMTSCLHMTRSWAGSRLVV